jgi:hypothetical protein
MGGTLLLCSLLFLQQSVDHRQISYDDQSRRRQLEKLHERFDEFREGWGHLRGNFPHWMNPPRVPKFFLKKAPLPQEDRSNWVPRQFNGETFYLVPCTAPSTRPAIAPRTQ